MLWLSFPWSPDAQRTTSLRDTVWPGWEPVAGQGQAVAAGCTIPDATGTTVWKGPEPGWTQPGPGAQSIEKRLVGHQLGLSSTQPGTQTMWHGHKNRCRTEAQKPTFRTCSHLSFSKGAKNIRCRKDSSFNKWFGKTEYPQNTEVRPLSLTLYYNKIKMN